MTKWMQLLTPILLFWCTSAFMHFRKKVYPKTGNLFDYQDWGVWLGPFAITTIFFIQFVGPKLMRDFRGNPLAVTLLWLTEIACFVGILLFFRKGLNHSFTALGFFSDQILFRFVSGLRWIVGLYFIYTFIAYNLFGLISPDQFSQIISRYDPKDASIVIRSMSFFDSKWGVFSLLIPFFYFIIYGSIYQEVVFRGFLYGPIRKKVGGFFGIIITSLLFTFTHYGLTVSGFLDIFLHGILFAFLYESTQSLIPSIFSHVISNMFILSGYFAQERENVSFEMLEIRGRWTLFVFAVLFILVMLSYRWMLKKGFTLKVPNLPAQQ